MSFVNAKTAVGEQNNYSIETHAVFDRSYFLCTWWWIQRALLIVIDILNGRSLLNKGAVITADTNRELNPVIIVVFDALETCLDILNFGLCNQVVS